MCRQMFVLFMVHRYLSCVHEYYHNVLLLTWSHCHFPSCFYHCFPTKGQRVKSHMLTAACKIDTHSQEVFSYRHSLFCLSVERGVWRSGKLINSVTGYQRGKPNIYAGYSGEPHLFRQIMGVVGFSVHSVLDRVSILPLPPLQPYQTKASQVGLKWPS